MRRIQARVDVVDWLGEKQLEQSNLKLSEAVLAGMEAGRRATKKAEMVILMHSHADALVKMLHNRLEHAISTLEQRIKISGLPAE